MKILIIVGHEGIYSGASYQALYLAMGLRDRGHEVHCIWGPKSGDPSLEVVEKAGLSLHCISMQRKFDLGAILQLRSLLRRASFDVVHCFKGIAMYRLLWASYGISIPALIFNREVSKPLEYFQGSKYRSRRVDLVVADSEAVRQVLIRSGRLQPQSVRVIYDEVDLERYHPEVDGSDVRREFGVGDDDFFCGVIGNYAPWRGQEDFIRAAAQIQDHGSDFAHLKFLLVGKDTDNLMPLAVQLGVDHALRFSGFRPDLERVVAALDLVVNCSTEVESLSGAITIAMAMGKPVVGTSIAGTPELIENGVTGLLVPPADPDAMAEAMMQICGTDPDARREMGRRARRKMEMNFSRPVRAERIESLYMEIIRRKTGTESN
jgi:glycosyltransferase involved in cell wall biosynthesis